MLLIAQPKSASTSLLWTLSNIMGVAQKNGQNRRKGEKPCNGFTELQKYHGTTVQRTYNFLYDYICKPNILYKEHILPTDRHIEIIDDINRPVVVLLRDPVQTIESYERVFSVIPEVKVNYNKLEKELIDFHNVYIKKSAGNKIYKIITFHDITKNFTETIKDVILHYGKEVPKDIGKYKLCKRNYTYR